jgi:branched-chain amino acid aminotransferase
MKIYIDGNYFDKDDAKISVFDHGLLYGDGVFEGIRVYENRVFLLEKHLERLYASAKAIALDIPLIQDELAKAVLESVSINKTENGYIRLIVTRGVGNLGVDPESCDKPSVIIIVGNIELYPASFYAQGISIVTSSTRRVPSDVLDPRIKSLNYLNNVLAKIEARKAGCLEAVMLNKEGYVAECTGDNIFIVKNNVLCTPEPQVGALSGITRGFVLSIASELNIETRECLLTRYDLYNADECFLTGTGAELMPVTSIDGRVIASGDPGMVTKALRDAFKKRAAS